MIDREIRGVQSRTQDRIEGLTDVDYEILYDISIGLTDKAISLRRKLSTRRGTIELAARLDRDVPEGMVYIPFCFAEAPANFLTNPQLDPFGKIPEFKFCAAKVEPAAADAAAAE